MLDAIELKAVPPLNTTRLGGKEGYEEAGSEELGCGVAVGAIVGLGVMSGGMERAMVAVAARR